MKDGNRQTMLKWKNLFFGHRDVFHLVDDHAKWLGKRWKESNNGIGVTLQGQLRKLEMALWLLKQTPGSTGTEQIAERSPWSFRANFENTIYVYLVGVVCRQYKMKRSMSAIGDCTMLKYWFFYLLCMHHNAWKH